MRFGCQTVIGQHADAKADRHKQKERAPRSFLLQHGHQTVTRPGDFAPDCLGAGCRGLKIRAWMVSSRIRKLRPVPHQLRRQQLGWRNLEPVEIRNQSTLCHDLPVRLDVFQSHRVEHQRGKLRQSEPTARPLPCAASVLERAAIPPSARKTRAPFSNGCLMTEIVTRFAPSPTGYLHIGGARTALFNWLYARKTGGKMLLRIEDTDRERSSDDAVAAIIDGLAWLGLDCDGEPVSQYGRVARHQEVAHALVEAGKAYRCYATAEELNAMREEQRAQGKPPRYDGRWRDRDPSEAPAGAPFAIRIKSPDAGETIVRDAVQGDVRFPNADLDDFIILRSDGNPTYMLAVVVDDHDMGVTDIIRGDDHLTNAARQQVIYDAMGWTIPRMAHIPLIHGADGAKLSKRHGALGVEAYRAMGYLPQALRNYLVRLGWSHGDDEIMSIEQMIEWFDVSDINKGASRFDFAKLEALNGHYIRAMEDGPLIDLLMETAPYLPSGSTLDAAKTEPGATRLAIAMTGLKQRAKTLEELAENAGFLFAQVPLVMDEKAMQLIAEAPAGLLTEAHDALAALPVFDAESTEACIRALADTVELKLGKVAQPLRAALTGRATSPGLFDVMAALGREETLARLQAAVGNS